MLFFSPQQSKTLQSLIQYNVEFMIVGGYAVKFYLPHRSTYDLDLLINITQENRCRLILALKTHINDALSFIDGLQQGKSFKTIDNQVEFLPDYKSYLYNKLKPTASQFYYNQHTILIIGLTELISIKKNYTDAKHLEDVFQLLQISNNQPLQTIMR